MAEIAHVQNPVTAFACSKGWVARRMSYLGRRGCPDSWFFKAGQVIIIEFKDLGKPLRLNQEREIGRLLAAGLDVHVIDNFEDGCALFE